MITTLRKGQRYSATRTGKNRHGERFYRTFTFVAAHDQEVEPFIRREDSVDQDRVFVEQATRFGTVQSVPDLVVTGSIEVAE